MNKEKFWQLIDDVNSEVGEESQEKIIEATEKKLLDLEWEELGYWFQICAIYREILHRKEIEMACMIINKDHKSYTVGDFIGWIISKGKNVYMDCLNSPDSLVKLNVKEGEARFEEYNLLVYSMFGQKISNMGLDVYSIPKVKTLPQEIKDEIQSEIPPPIYTKKRIMSKDMELVMPELYKKYNESAEENMGLSL
ncbi:MAG: DUF4240 domain-containing protein [Clostridiales bacterium]|nr:DUF4240 domain-containing protein [Clostridiales bacterium]